MDAVDVVEISQVLTRYGQIVDTHAWDDLPEVFTGDAVFDISDFGQGLLEGLHAIRKMFEHSSPPYSVNIVNVVVSDGEEPGTARAYSKNLGLLPKGRVGSASYDDELVKTDAGWRVRRRLATARRADGS
jgi:SnoaL-like domain